MKEKYIVKSLKAQDNNFMVRFLEYDLHVIFITRIQKTYFTTLQILVGLNKMI